MPISLKPDLERLVIQKVQSGQYSSADEVIRKGLELLHARDEAAAKPPSPGPSSVWETLSTLASEVPAEDWARVPADLSKNLDHYLYGTPRIAE
jgi:Arc/MetJ-type ribon-helix-helix transcriptional regulator